MEMDLLTLGEFQHLSKLTDHDVLGMLENGELKTTLGPLGELLIDITDLNPDAIAMRLSRHPTIVDPEEERIIEETITSVIIFQFEEIIGEALQLASQWYSNEEKLTDR